MNEPETDDKLSRLDSMVRVWAVHLQEAHSLDVELPFFDTDDDCFVMSCRACNFPWSVEGLDAMDGMDDDARYVLVEQS